MISFFINLVDLIIQLLSLLILAHVVLSYFMSPFHPIRQTIDRLVEPLLQPIRRVVPIVGVFDLSPLVLLILVQLIGSILKNLLISLI